MPFRGGLWSFAVVCGSLGWFAMVCGGLSYSHTGDTVIVTGTGTVP